MSARPDWRFAVAVMAVVLVVGLVVVVAQGPGAALFGFEVANSAAAKSEECEETGAGAAGKGGEEQAGDAGEGQAQGQDDDEGQKGQKGEKGEKGEKGQKGQGQNEGQKGQGQKGQGQKGRNGQGQNEGQEQQKAEQRQDEQEQGQEQQKAEQGQDEQEQGQGQDEQGQGQQKDEQGQDEGGQGQGQDAEECEDGAGDDAGGQAGDDEEFAGRDQIGEAADDEYVDIAQVDENQDVGEGGDFSGGTFSIDCALSDHKNSDNPIIAPGVRNGAQHTHDYAGNESTNFASDQESLEAAGTTCTNGDKHPFFWPVLRDLNGTGPDVGEDGGSLDGNVGSFIEPSEVAYEFRGHGSAEIQPMPVNLVLSTGSAKAGTADGEGANAKYTCSGQEARVTDQYPLCPQGSSLQRIFDFPSCWNGEDLDSEDHISHLVFPDEQGECESGDVPVPATRITVSYDPPQGRAFAIDTFPEQQHDPITDHALFENLTSEQRAEDGAACINANQQCLQGAADNVAFSSDARDQVPPSLNFAHALSSHADRGDGRRAAPELSVAQATTLLVSAGVVMLAASVGLGPRLAAHRSTTHGRRGRGGEDTRRAIARRGIDAVRRRCRRGPGEDR